jgi:hypothetical protein
MEPMSHCFGAHIYGAHAMCALLIALLAVKICVACWLLNHSVANSDHCCWHGLDLSKALHGDSMYAEPPVISFMSEGLHWPPLQVLHGACMRHCF